ncbi:MAG: hypothetical protein WC188_10210 [Candidatus Caldatribacteriota bacterium]
MTRTGLFLKPYKKYLIIPLVFLSILAVIMSMTAIAFAYFSKDAIDSANGQSDNLLKTLVEFFSGEMSYEKFKKLCEDNDIKFATHVI